MALFIACAVLGIVIPVVAIKLFGLGKSVLSEPEPVADPAPVAAVPPVAPVPLRPVEVVAPTNPAYHVEGVFCTGVLQMGERIICMLSDGSQVTNQHESLEAVYAGSHIVLSGRRVPIKAKNSSGQSSGVVGALSGDLNGNAGVSGAAVQPFRRLIDPTIRIGPEQEARLPRSSGVMDPTIRSMLDAGSAGLENIEFEVRRRLRDPIHR